MSIAPVARLRARRGAVCLWLLLLACALSVLSAGAAEPSPSPVNPIPPDTSLPSGAHLSAEARQAAKDGISAMAKNKFEAAEASFLKLLQLAPDNLSALVNLGLVEFRLGKMNESRGYLEQAVHQKADSWLPWMMLGVVRDRLGDLEGATAALAQAVYLNPKSPQAHNYFAAAMSRRGWFSAAEDELQKAVQLNPDFAEAHYNLALTYMQQTPPAVELARRHYQKALELGAEPDAELRAKLDAAPEPSSVP